MAIIYTYPKLTNPQGNELIVVSDVNNKNSTRLITIADIASLVPGGGGGGCSSAIAGILTGAGDYIPPLCNEVTFEGNGINISADQATATVTFTVPEYELPCPTLALKGGITGDVLSEVSTPSPAESGTYYPVQIIEETCSGAVRIPDSQSYVLPCATPTTLGGIKAQNNVGVISVPDVSPTGTYYPIELMKDPGVVTGADCTAIVKIPTTTVSCASATTLGSIKAPKVVLAAPPEIPAEGTYYSIETISETSDPDDECRAVVKIPTPEITIDCATNTTNGGIKITNPALADVPAPAESGSVYPIQVDANCVAGVRVPDPEPVSSNGELLHSNLFIGTNVSQTNPPQHALNEADAVTTVLNQVEFNPATTGTGGTSVDVYAFCKRPINADDTLRVVFNFSLKHADNDGAPDEFRIFAGLHHTTGNIAPSSLTYGWQGNGYTDSDDTFFEVNNYRFAWDITVSDLLAADGDPAVPGENCYFFLKMSYMTNAIEPSSPTVLFGQYFSANYTSTATSTMLNGIPCTADTYLLANNKHNINPVLV